MVDTPYLAALRTRGIECAQLIITDIWPTCYSPDFTSLDRRFARARSWIKAEIKNDGGETPFEGLITKADLTGRKVLDLEDSGVISPISSFSFDIGMAPVVVLNSYLRSHRVTFVNWRNSQ